MELDPVQAGAGLSVADLLPELERPFVVRLRLGEAGAALGGAPRIDGRLECARQIVGGEPVPGQVADDRVRVARQPGMSAQHLPVRRVQPRALLGEELVVHGLTDELVAKRVAAEAARFEHVVRHRSV